MVERNERRNRGFRAGSDDDVSGWQFGLSARTRHLHVVMIEKAGGDRKHVDSVARKLRANHIDFRLDDIESAEREISHSDRLLHAIIDAVNALVLIPGKMQNGFADGLARDRAGIDGGSADHFQLFDERRPLAKFPRLNRGPLPSGPGAHHDEIVLFHGLPRDYTTFPIPSSLLTRVQPSRVHLMNLL